MAPTTAETAASGRAESPSFTVIHGPSETESAPGGGPAAGAREASAQTSAAHRYTSTDRSAVDREDMAGVYAAKPAAYKVAKRIADVVLAGGALVVLSPILAATAIAIVAEDGRPVIYAAPRKGKDGKAFRMYKFRSMYRDAESKLAELLDQNEQTGPAFKIKDDPRITRVGRFIRKWSIDELPQLANIVKGDMSIVGPRAIQQTQEYTAHEAQRLVVQPGLTCYWQVSGRAEIGWEEWVELDLDYIQDMSLSTDALMVLRTFPVVLKGSGSY